MKVKLRDIEMAFEFVNSAGPEANTALLDKSTGKVHYHSEYGDLEEISDDLWENPDCVGIPHKNDLDLGHRLVFRFVGAKLPDDYEMVNDFFHSRGAYGRYKSLLERRRLLNEWYDFEAKAMEQAIRSWCDENQVELDPNEPDAPAAE